MTWSNVVLGLLGLWEIVAAYLYIPSGGGRVVMFITGLVVAILGFWGSAMATDSVHRGQMQH